MNRSEEFLKVNKFEQIGVGGRVDWGPYVGKGQGFWGCPQSELRMRAVKVNNRQETMSNSNWCSEFSRH